MILAIPSPMLLRLITVFTKLAVTHCSSLPVLLLSNIVAAGKLLKAIWSQYNFLANTILERTRFNCA
jgi:Na+-translocating ferredoxin:NAD+ oxidoreductase RnfA subunit